METLSIILLIGSISSILFVMYCSHKKNERLKEIRRKKISKMNPTQLKEFLLLERIDKLERKIKLI